MKVAARSLPENCENGKALFGSDLRKTLESLTTDSDEGMATRELFGIPHERDRHHNIILQSSVPAAADILAGAAPDGNRRLPKSIENHCSPLAPSVDQPFAISGKNQTRPSTDG